jgi:phospholipase C
MSLFDSIIDRLRHDDTHPLHALDAWLLFVAREVSPTEDLSVLARFRVGPRPRYPELASEEVARWARYVVAEGLLESVPGEDHEQLPVWTVTPAGHRRLRTLRGPVMRLGSGLARATRRPDVWSYAVQRLLEQSAVGTGKPPPKRTWVPKIERSPGDDEAISAERARANLDGIDHIVVLMLENRSFDHMLGYLDLLDGQDEVDGLSHARPITYDGRSYGPEYLTKTAFPKSMDPPHGREEIARQINHGAMDGFIESFAGHTEVEHPERVMGYYTHRELPVYDYFAQNFVVCDRWFSSVPSATWPNRLCSLTGTCVPGRENLFDGDEPLYDLPSFVRLLADAGSDRTWRWYSWDPGTLRYVDGRFRLDGAGFHHDHFRRVVQNTIEPGVQRDPRTGERIIELGRGFLQDAANGDLPSVAWIDPNFVDLSILESNSNDDHPPSDVRAGQELVMTVFRALAESPCWKKTMLVVTYDEHGGFYDHVAPTRPPEDPPLFHTYGVRVPAFVVSPLVEGCRVTHTTFDHTSIVRTILERFGVEGAVEAMAATAPRVARAEHLGRLLTVDPSEPRPVPEYGHVNDALSAWRHFRAERRSAASPVIAAESRSKGDDWTPPAITGFPAEFLDGARELRRLGLPPGHS